MTDLDDVPTDELQDEYQEIAQEAYDTLGHPDAVDYDRMHSIWTELEDRLDPEYPECPECGAEEWTQSPGDPKRCGDCGRGLLEGEDDIRQAVNDEWTRVGRTGGDSA